MNASSGRLSLVPGDADHRAGVTGAGMSGRLQRASLTLSTLTVNFPGQGSIVRPEITAPAAAAAKGLFHVMHAVVARTTQSPKQSPGLHFGCDCSGAAQHEQIAIRAAA